MTEKTLAEKYIEEIGGQELRPPIRNNSMLVHQSGWHTLKYFQKYYKNSTAYPLLLMMKEGEDVMYLPITKEKELAKEIFHLYWKDSEFLEKRYMDFQKYAQRIDAFLEKELTYANINDKSEVENIKTLEALEDATWNMNALAFFSIYFDRKICEELLKEVEAGISPDKVEEIWSKATIIPGLSFEKRRHLYLLGLIAESHSWDEIAEKCQYFETAYDRVIPVSEIKIKFQSKYKSLTPAEAQGMINEENIEVAERVKENQIWILSLSEEEKKIVKFTQFLIELRDVRKDHIMKAVTGFYRIGEWLFEKAGIPKEIIFFASVDNLKKGIQYLKEHKEEIEKRILGVVLLVHNDNTQELEYGVFEDNKKILEGFYKNQQDHDTEGKIKGQRGSSGVIRGVVKIINYLQKEQDKLKPGEILVTGMTRPEFVPLMRIASGVITDEGGITCHAAIVARELGIPCVIGTKIATQVLKDGDMVEIDADKGIVTILPK